MLVQRSEIGFIDMIEWPNNDPESEPDFCVRFYVGDSTVIIPCFFAAGFPLKSDPESKEKQLRLTQEYLDAHPDNAYVLLDSAILYNMNVYH